MINLGLPSYIHNQRSKEINLFFVKYTKLRVEKCVPRGLDLTFFRLPGHHSITRPQKQGCTRILFTVDKPFSVVFNMAPENLDPMPRNIFLLEPRIRSPYELGLLCLAVLWIQHSTTGPLGHVMKKNSGK